MNVSRWLARGALAGVAASIGLVATGAAFTPAIADTPTKVAWWNFAAAGGAGAPSPDVPAGGMRIGVSSQQDLAFGAVEYSLPADGTATLTLNVAQMTGSGSEQLNAIEACPTKDDSWKAGDDQDAATAPAYDCGSRHFAGELDSAGKTVTFLIDGSADITPGVLSLAIVAVHTTGVPAVGTDPGTGTDLTPPFVVDFAKPDSSGFVVTGGSQSAPPPPAPVPASGSGAPATSTGGTTVPASLPSGGNVTVPTTTEAGQTPVVAGNQAPVNSFAPQAAAKPATTGDDTKRNLLLVLLVLLGFGILSTQNQGARQPRLLTRTRAGAAAAVPVEAAAMSAPRGLGRFAKARTGPARPLI